MEGLRTPGSEIVPVRDVLLADTWKQRGRVTSRVASRVASDVRITRGRRGYRRGEVWGRRREKRLVEDGLGLLRGE